MSNKKQKKFCQITNDINIAHLDHSSIQQRSTDNAQEYSRQNSKKLEWLIRDLIKEIKSSTVSEDKKKLAQQYAEILVL